MIPYIRVYIQSWHTWSAQKEATSCTRFYVQGWRWIGKIFNSNLCELILLHWFLRWYLYLVKISCQAEVVTSPCRSVTATSGFTSAGCHLTHQASDLGAWSDALKVRLYNTFLDGLCQAIEGIQEAAPDKLQAIKLLRHILLGKRILQQPRPPPPTLLHDSNINEEPIHMWDQTICSQPILPSDATPNAPQMGCTIIDDDDDVPPHPIPAVHTGSPPSSTTMTMHHRLSNACGLELNCGSEQNPISSIW